MTIRILCKTLVAGLGICAALLVSISHAQPQDPAQITLGNGALNHIETRGVQRDGATFTFARVTSNDNAFLVLHPVRDGRPVGHIYVAAEYLPKGTSTQVTATVDSEYAQDSAFLVMLHRDVNEDQVFDFGDGRQNVPDVPVFEGSRMIAAIINLPLEQVGESP